VYNVHISDSVRT